MKIAKLTKIQFEILTKVCTNQEILRLVIYNTRSPLQDTYKWQSGDINVQPDIEDNIYNENKRVYLYNNGDEFHDNLDSTIVIRRENCTLIEEQTGSIKIDIICPIDYSILDDALTQTQLNRECEIADRIIAIANTVNGVVVTNSHESVSVVHKQYNVLTLDLLYTDNLQTVPLA
ncbi:hypothetical protein LL033_11950 [Clostridium estertheticum]|uniref:hypothetical protein n=1 Tax=Clostridium estertheticum TaxID=238834 RepID=UPI001C0C88EA|nr:hypothetical protein [Clostridium estertheticum]MBU3215864.1 hypothetical protein [Clostridium estertheticum]WAG57820.1 hypothetical protein LL033_11950 [Clostridium estertheticum]